MKCVSLTHVGRVRTENQDSVINLKDLRGAYFFGVADGMGGHKAGDVASMTLTKELEKFFKKCDKKKCFANPESICRKIEEINRKIYDMACENPDYEGMGTTLTLAFTNGKTGYIYQIGDSRAYLINEGGINQITKDQSLVQFMVDTKQITPEEAEIHPSRHVILAAVGTEEDIETEVYNFALNKDDILLICSDGLSDNFKNEEIEEIIRKAPNLKNCAAELVSEANKRGGKDNISVVLFEA